MTRCLIRLTKADFKIGDDGNAVWGLPVVCVNGLLKFQFLKITNLRQVRNGLRKKRFLETF